MGDIFIFLVAIAGLAWVFRLWRKREIERFRESDMSMLRQVAGNDLMKHLPEHLSPTSAPAVAGSEAASPDLPAVELKNTVLDEIHAGVLAHLETILDDSYRVFVNRPLTELVRLKGDPSAAMGKVVSFVVCDRETLRLAVGITLRGAGPKEAARYRYLESVFRSLEMPLVDFPMMPNLSLREIEERLTEVTPYVLRRRGSESSPSPGA